MQTKFAYHLLAFAVVAVWGVTFISTKVLIGAGLHPAQIFAIRFVIAYAGIWLLCLARDRKASSPLVSREQKASRLPLARDRKASSLLVSREQNASRLPLARDQVGARTGVSGDGKAANTSAPSSESNLASTVATATAPASESATATTSTTATASAIATASASTTAPASATASATAPASATAASSRVATRIVAASVRDELLFVLLGVTGGSVYFLTENSALACTQACNVSFIVCSAPLITALLTLIAKRVLKGDLRDGLEDVSGRWTLVIGSLMALCGMAAVIFDGSALHLSARGDLLALGAALCWGTYSVFMSQMTTRYGALMATRKVFFYGLITIVPFLVGQPLRWDVIARPEVWGNLLFLSLAASLACFVLWNKVMAQIGNVTSTNYVYLNPFFTLVAAVLLLGESLTMQSAAGCLLIIGGVVVGGLKKRGRE